MSELLEFQCRAAVYNASCGPEHGLAVIATVFSACAIMQNLK